MRQMAPRLYDNILTRDFLKRAYVIEQQSAYRISKLVGCSSKTVGHYLSFHDIERIQPSYRYKRVKSEHPNWKGVGNLPSSYFTNLKKGAENRNIPFFLTKEDLWKLFESQNGKCALSGEPIDFVRCKKSTASLDRKNATLPYEIGNVWWVHKDVNYAKQSLSVEEFIAMCKKIAEHNP